MTAAFEQVRLAKPKIALVLGSGLGSVADAFQPEFEVPYAEVPGWPTSKVPGHAGKLLLGRMNDSGLRVLIAQGRSHLYEGLSAFEVTAGIRLMIEQWGIRRFVLTNAAGAIDPQFAVGGLMMIRDHLNLLGSSPLTGGPHFHDMSSVYASGLRHALKLAAEALEIRLFEGVYAAVPGPQYETPAEVRMLKALGAQAVGMSTVPEAIQARALGAEVIGISMLTNWAAGLASQTLDHSEVIQVGATASQDLARLLQSGACEVGL